jgi:hypothetical protein
VFVVKHPAGAVRARRYAPLVSDPVSKTAAIRYRCSTCGNLTRFDVTSLRRTRAFHHYTVGGDLEVEEVEVLDERVESVVCHWCGVGDAVVEISDDDSAAPVQSTEG